MACISWFNKYLFICLQSEMRCSSIDWKEKREVMSSDSPGCLELIVEFTPSSFIEEARPL